MMESLHAVSSECIFIIHFLLKRSVTAHSAEVQTGLILVCDLPPSLAALDVRNTRPLNTILIRNLL